MASTASSLVQAWRGGCLPLGPPVSILFPAHITPSSHKQPEETLETPSQVLSLLCPEPSKTPVSLKARANAFPVACRALRDLALAACCSQFPLASFIWPQPHWPVCYSPNMPNTVLPQAPCTGLPLAWNTLSSSLHGQLFSLFRSLVKCHLLREGLLDHPVRTTLDPLDHLPSLFST